MTAINLFSVEVDGDDEAVETEHLGENEDQDHADEETGLLGRSSHARVSHDADREARRQSTEADRETGAQVHEAAEDKHTTTQLDNKHQIRLILTSLRNERIF